MLNRRSREHGATRITVDIDAALTWWDSFLRLSEPRSITVGGADPPLLIWTDGAHEEDGEAPTSCGAVLFDPADRALLYFGCAIDEELRSLWQVKGTRGEP